MGKSPASEVIVAPCQTDFGVELKSERGLVAVTHQVPPGLLRYPKKQTNLMSVLYRIYCQFVHETNSTRKNVADLSHHTFNLNGKYGLRTTSAELPPPRYQNQ